MSENERVDVSPAEEYFRAVLRFAQFRMIQKEISAQEANEESPGLDERVLRRIETRFREIHRKTKLKKNAESILKSAMIVLMIFSLCATAAFALSGALREQAMKLFVVTHPIHSDVYLANGNDSPVTFAESGEFPEYRVTWFPNERFTVSEQIVTPLLKSITYTSADGATVILDVSGEGVSAAVNTEGLEKKTVFIGGKEIIVFQSDQRGILIWEANDLCFVLKTMHLTEAEAILMALLVCPADTGAASGTDP